MDLLLFGIQGSGKGTMAKMLADRFGCYWFDAGGELRKISATNTELGRSIAGRIDHGNLVTNEIMMEVTRLEIGQFGSDRSILFDGIPRYKEQKESFDEMMREMRREMRGIVIDVDEELAVQRLLARGKQGGRQDDQDEEYIRRRIGWSKEKTFPIIEEYAEQGIIARVDGDGTPDVVHDRMMVALEQVGFTVG